MSFGPQPWHGPPQYDERAVGARPPVEREREDAEEAARLGVGLRLGVRIGVVWLLYVLAAALLPAVYGTRVAGPVSLGVVLAVVPFAVGLHALVVYGRRIDRLEPEPDARGRS
ncbi:hypothetical protein [Streptomyces sp. BK79]|uniref:hypothetical protein n=1 Tax=Streptomyces sp. BK79 TaxID=3350097 RepID=UPI00376FDE32